MTAAERLRRVPAVVWRAVAGEVLLAPPGREDFEHLSPTGGAVWELLSAPHTVPEVIDALARAYRQPAGTIAGEVQELLSQLRERGLVEVTP